ncbi:MAG: MurR/RpiR family transcriptional regulator [Alphaproteobacteria bacterium]|nr:MAG: MurR/RpiR family transcriptional regulator [Alphaproteobacteria bacterium]
MNGTRGEGRKNRRKIALPSRTPSDEPARQSDGKQGEASGTPPTDMTTLKRRLAERGGKMSRVFRAIATYLTQRPEEAAMASMREVAQRLAVDPANLVRFAKSLGFSGYSDLKKVLQAEVCAGLPAGDYIERAAHLQQAAAARRHGADRLLAELQASNEANIKALAERNPVATMEACGRALARAQTIHVCGMRSCFSAAFAFAYAARMVRERVRLMDGLGGTFADSLREIGPRDVLLVIGMAPYSAASVKAARFAAERGAKVIAMTDTSISPLARHATHILEFPREGAQIPGTVMPAVALAEVLASVMIAKGGRRFLDTLKASEEQLACFSAYADEPAAATIDKKGR